jgi:hypothetical protein
MIDIHFYNDWKFAFISMISCDNGMIDSHLLDASIGVILTSIQALGVNVGLVLLLLQVHKSTDSVVSNLEDSEVMVGIVLLLVFVKVITTLKVHDLSTI